MAKPKAENVIMPFVKYAHNHESLLFQMPGHSLPQTYLKYPLHPCVSCLTFFKTNLGIIFIYIQHNLPWSWCKNINVFY